VAGIAKSATTPAQAYWSLIDHPLAPHLSFGGTPRHSVHPVSVNSALLLCGQIPHCSTLAAAAAAAADDDDDLHC